MAEPPTPRYALQKPEVSDSMSNFETWLNGNWDKIADVPAPPNGTTLPQSGSYNVGDRFYKTDTKSIYILVAKDANWGWHWRPIQDAISPWFTVPNTCMAISGWTLNPVAANPFAIALDNRGRCYWRGVIGASSGTISRNVSHQVFRPLPLGIRPRERGAFMLGHETLSVGTDGTNLNCYQGARIFIFADDLNEQSVRCVGGTAEFNRVHLTGVNYAVGSSLYTSP
jgi:hypothetical protein